MGLVTALKLLTIFPVPLGKGNVESIGKSLPYFPLVGLLLGSILLGLSCLFSLALPAPVTAILLVIALTVMTGAHHFDGLIDTCDALVVGKSREERLAIMSDTRVGSFGIAGACLILVAKYAAIASMTAFPGLLLMPALSRWAVTCAIISFPSARSSGMGFLFRQDARWLHFAVATIITLAAAMLLEGVLRGCALLAIVIVPVLCCAAIFNKLFGGLTGDSYGALIEIGDVLALIILVMLGSLWACPDISLIDLTGIRQQ
jgi:adenosylcobinamide-GDP ribazoletransferase